MDALPTSDPERPPATFLQRFVANLVDGMLIGMALFPGTLLVGYGPANLAIIVLVLIAPVHWAYTSYCHGGWGKTLGKHIMDIQVVRAADGGPVSYRRALLRDVGAIAFGAVGTLILIDLVRDGNREYFRVFDGPALEPYDPENPVSPGELFRDSLSAAFPNWQLMVVSVVQWIWAIGELVTMLSNRRRRAIHDFIGGTMVVRPAHAGRPNPLR
jgi:uncharacterized RDD family membrane protein YckC